MKIDPNKILQKENEKFYLRDEVLKILQEKLPSVLDYEKINEIRGNKYIELALKYNCKNYRICTVYDIYSLGLFNSFSYFAKEFINNSGRFLVILNELNGKPISSVFRGLDKKDFFDFSVYYCPYGLDLIDENFRYGDYLVLTEGIYDADCFRGIYKNTISMLTSSITIMQAEILNTLTNKFILIYDNDEAGKEGIEKSYKRLKNINPKAEVEIIRTYPDDKDIGEMEEYLLKGKKEEYEIRRDYYRSMIDSYIGRGF